uniref:Uncharacterized protein n=1 Tax=Rhizophora mucronata TaxID=61149 RepID=A0A2P2JZU2_RHIMU
MGIAVLPFPEALGVVSISSGAAAAGPSKDFHRLASVFSGIIMCTTVYNFTGFISFLCFKGYGKLSNAQKIEWNNRGFSTIHALIVASASLYLLLWSGLFDEDSQDELIVNRSSVLSNSICGVS